MNQRTPDLPGQRDRRHRTLDARPALYVTVAERLVALQRRLRIDARGRQPTMDTSSPPPARDNVDPKIRAKVRALGSIIDLLPAVGKALSLRSQDIVALIAQQSGAWTLHGLMQSILIGCADARLLTSAGHRLLRRHFTNIVATALLDPSLSAEERARIELDFDEVRMLIEKQSERTAASREQSAADRAVLEKQAATLSEKELLMDVIDALKSGSPVAWKKQVRAAEVLAQQEGALAEDDPDRRVSRRDK